MSIEKPDRLEIESVDAYVVYEPDSGAIVHVHRAFNYRGAERLPSGEVGERRALEMAERFGHRTEGLRVLSVSPDELEGGGRRRVDPKSRKLVTAREPDTAA